ncbi:nuclear receptor subfamily 2, group C, member 2, isoform CRA_b, partial [Mus musculus]
HPGLTGTSQIEKFQEKAQMELQDYVQKTYSEDTYSHMWPEPLPGASSG